MYTQCSSCATLFRVSARHLREAGGRVRCCLCHEAFDALETLTERLPAGLSEDAGVASELRLAAAVPDMGVEPAARAEPALLPAQDEAGDEAGDEDEEQKDLFVDLNFQARTQLELEPPSPQRRRPLLPTLGWVLGAVLLLALLLAQYVYMMRNELAADPRVRPLVETLCQVAGCELPLLRNLDQLHFLQQRIMEHPELPDALLVKATLVNEAGYNQPYPEVLVRFEGGPERWFRPQEYLEDPALRARITDGMPPKQPVALTLELVHPGADLSGSYILDLR